MSDLKVIRIMADTDGPNMISGLVWQSAVRTLLGTVTELEERNHRLEIVVKKLQKELEKRNCLTCGLRFP
jgi:hypothetical protein